MIDFHCHILPGLDDGPVSVDDSIAMARALSAFGYKTVCCTPHCIKGYYDVTPQRVREATLMLQADLDNADIELELWPGIEYTLDENFFADVDDLMPLGPTRLVLCEAPQNADHETVQAGLAQIAEKGFVPFVAHPERTEYFYGLLTREALQGDTHGEGAPSAGSLRQPPRARGFWSNLFKRETPERAASTPAQQPAQVDHLLYHANLGSFTGYYGPQVQAQAYELLKLKAYASVASDLHDSRSASEVLAAGKLDTNPLLKKLAEFDGTTPTVPPAEPPTGQGELF